MDYSKLSARERNREHRVMHNSMALAVLAGLVGAVPVLGQAVRVSGRITIQEKGNKPTPDLGDAVVYLEGGGEAPPPARFDVTISDKVFSPHVLVVPAGSTVAFPNHDPFDHNVFSVSEPNSFDLGLYGRGEGKSQT
ncbi:MAG: cupredoxin domain-containing protein, partial [Gemmatimonadales bacterium]